MGVPVFTLQPPELGTFIVSLVFGVFLHYSHSIAPTRIGGISEGAPLPYHMARGRQNSRDTRPFDRIDSISRVLVFARRRGPGRLNIQLYEAGWAPLSHFLEFSEQLEKLKVAPDDVRRIIRDPNSHKRRLEAKRNDDGVSSVRTYQGAAKQAEFRSALIKAISFWLPRAFSFMGPIQML